MKARLLLVEDSEVNAYLARFLLEREGYVVEVALNGEQALSAARQRRPDLVLMDIRLPVMDGYEATRRIRADPQLADVPVVALSAHALALEKAQALACGCIAHIDKPIEVEHFVDQVRSLLPTSLR